MPTIRANGIDIEYESFGRSGDPAILLIMGFAASLVFWPDSLCKGLAAKGFRAVRFDNRDIGRSTHLTALGTPNLAAMMAAVQKGARATPPYTLDDMAADAAALLDALGVQRAHIVGASMGGMIAQLVAINHPEKATSLVSIMSTTGRPPGPAGGKAGSDGRDHGSARKRKPRGPDREWDRNRPRARQSRISGERGRDPRPT